MIAARALGSTGVTVTELGLGGEGVLRSHNREREAVATIDRALELGVRYFDTAPAYAGSMDYLGAALGERRAEAFLASKVATRGRDRSLAALEQSLRRLRTDRLDLLQLHDVETETDLKRIFAPRGVIHALDQARAEGTVRFVGLTGHHRPEPLLRALAEYPFDVVLIPLNPADHVRLPFFAVLEEARRRGIGVIAMKVLAGGLLLDYELCSAEEALRYALSLPGVSAAIVGCSTPAEVEENARNAAAPPMSAAERAELERRCAYAALTPYKARRP